MNKKLLFRTSAYSVDAIGRRTPRAQSNRDGRKKSHSVSSNQRQYLTLIKQSSHLNSIRKAIKKNDISFLVGDKQDKLRTQPNYKADQLCDNSHNKLIEVRKKYDDVKKQRANKFRKTQILKDRVKTLEVEHLNFQNKLQKTKQSTINGQQKLDQINDELENLRLTQDVLKNMKDRLLTDILFYKKSIKKANLNYKDIVNQHQQATRVHTSKLIQQKHSQSLLQKLHTHIQTQDKERREHLNNVNLKLENEIINKTNQKAWVQFTQTTAIQTLQARNNQQKQWNNLLLTNLLLKNILHNKIQNQMQKFGIVERTFQIIKTQTEIPDCQTFVHRYLKRDQIYGELLSKVTDCKHKQKQLLAQRESLLKQQHKLQKIFEEIQNQQYLFQNHEDDIDAESKKEVTKWNQRILLTREIYEGVREWVICQITKISRISKKKFPVSQNTLPSTMRELAEKLKMIFEIIKIQVSQSENQPDLTSIKLVNIQKTPKIMRSKTIEYEHTNIINSNISTVSFKEKQYNVADKQDSKQLHETQKTLVSKQKVQNTEVYLIDQEIFTIQAQRQQVHHQNDKYQGNRYRDKALQDSPKKFNKNKQ